MNNLAQTKTLLTDMAAEARELQSAAGGPITDTVAAWLASRYATSAHEKLAGASGVSQFEILRAFVQDWSQLRHGDHTAERLRIENERLKLAREVAENQCRNDEDKALDIVFEECKQFPEVQELFRAAFDALKKKSNK